MQNVNPILVVFVAATLLILALAMLGLAIWVLRPWMQGFLKGVPVTLIQILGMRLRGHPPSLIIDAYAQLQQRKIPITLGQLEWVYLTEKHRILTSHDLAVLAEKQPISK